MPGPILARELLVAGRAPQTFRARAGVAALMLVVFATGEGMWRYELGSEYRPSQWEMARFWQWAFGGLVAMQFMATIAGVPAAVAPAIAGERERGSLSALLTSRLTAAEIVLGKVAAGLVQHASLLAAGLPVMAALPLLGGIDPRLILLAYAGLASTSLFVASVAALVSIGQKNTRAAVGGTQMLLTAWFALPVLVLAIVPSVWPGGGPILIPAARRVAASSPTAVLFSGLGLFFGGRVIATTLEMIALQMAASAVLLAWAVVRLRPASRAVEGGGGWLDRLLRDRRRRRLWPRPACGDDPMLWKELHTGGIGGVLQVAGWAYGLALSALLGYGAWFVARRALAEVRLYGYGTLGDESHRIAFNGLGRVLGVIGVFAFLMMAAGFAAEGLGVERARGTLDALLTTPLTGREILRAKRLGALRRAGLAAALTAALWVLGTAVGAFHPLGLAAALAVVVVTGWLASAMGVLASLGSIDRARASAGALWPLILLTFAAAACYAPRPVGSVFWGAASAPFLAWLAPVSFRDVRDATASGDFPYLETMGLATGEGIGRVLATYLVGVVGLSLGAAALVRRAERRFDRAVGRPHRSGRATGGT